MPPSHHSSSSSSSSSSHHSSSGGSSRSFGSGRSSRSFSSGRSSRYNRPPSDRQYGENRPHQMIWVDDDYNDYYNDGYYGTGNIFGKLGFWTVPVILIIFAIVVWSMKGNTNSDLRRAEGYEDYGRSYAYEEEYDEPANYDSINSNVDIFGRLFTARTTADNTLGITKSTQDAHDKEFLWNDDYSSYKVQGTKDDWVWFNTDIHTQIWQYWFGDISKDYGDYGWMEYHYDTNEWYIEVTEGNWKPLDTSKYDTSKLWHFDNPYGERLPE